MNYRAVWRVRNGARYETYHQTDLAATDEDAAIEEALTQFNRSVWDDDADVELAVVGDDGEVYSARTSEPQQRQDELIAQCCYWCYEDQKGQHYLAHDTEVTEGWYTWTNAKYPRPVTTAEAAQWLTEHAGMDADDVAKIVEVEDEDEYASY
jgi:hypothetical protein